MSSRVASGSFLLTFLHVLIPVLSRGFSELLFCEVYLLRIARLLINFRHLLAFETKFLCSVFIPEALSQGSCTSARRRSASGLGTAAVVPITGQLHSWSGEKPPEALRRVAQGTGSRQRCGISPAAAEAEPCGAGTRSRGGASPPRALLGLSRRARPAGPQPGEGGGDSSAPPAPSPLAPPPARGHSHGAGRRGQPTEPGRMLAAAALCAAALGWAAGTRLLSGKAERGAECPARPAAGSGTCAPGAGERGARSPGQARRRARGGHASVAGRCPPGLGGFGCRGNRCGVDRGVCAGPPAVVLPVGLPAPGRPPHPPPGVGASRVPA